ncbi:cupin domain-containing protein [Polymorphospora rubra]
MPFSPGVRAVLVCSWFTYDIDTAGSEEYEPWHKVRSSLCIVQEGFGVRFSRSSGRRDRPARARTVVGPSLRAAGEWALRFDLFLHVRIGGLVRGTCWLVLDGHAPAFVLEGDTCVSSWPRWRLLSARPADPKRLQTSGGYGRNVRTVTPATSASSLLSAGRLFQFPFAAERGGCRALLRNCAGDDPTTRRNAVLNALSDR